VDIMRALVGIHHLKINHVPDHTILIADPITPQHVTRRAGDIECFATGVALHDGGNLNRIGPLVLHTPEPQTPL
jgi:hypothetical protein